MRKPATAADLDAAPVGTIAVDSHHNGWQKISTADAHLPTWWGIRLRNYQFPRDVLTNSPVTIVWTPEETHGD